MIEGGKGGANTLTGLNFEKDVDFEILLHSIKGYSIQVNNKNAGKIIYYKNEVVARLLKKHDFYRFLEEEKINWKEIISKRLLPDDALLVIMRDTLFIIEVKFQQVAGSVDEKLQTCDFKRKQYKKLVASLGLQVEYVYILNDWFKNDSYKDVLDYIIESGCHYRFNSIPLNWFGLPSE